MNRTPHPLKEVFKKAKVTQLDLEEYLGIHQSQISILLSGARKMSPEVEEAFFRAAKDLAKKN